MPTDESGYVATAQSLPAELIQHADQLTIGDVVDVALRNNPQTRESWAQARAAAAGYGSALGSYYPTVQASSSFGRTQTASNSGFGARSQVAPAVTLSYLLFDFGGRSGATAAARANAIALDLTHDATLQATALQTESAYFAYMEARALADAQRVTVAEAQQSVDAAQQRHRIGVATIADVLQAQTVLAQAQLDLETDSGSVQTGRGALATAMGLRANAAYEVAPPTSTPPTLDCDSTAVGVVAASVDTLIARAIARRPDLAAARADILRAEAEVRVARASALPALTLAASGGRTFSNVGAFQGPSYAVTLGLSVPIFNGFTSQYDVAAARANVQASEARADLLRTQVSNQVFGSYFLLRSATQRVRTAAVLLASAQQSESVASGRYRAGVGTILDLLAAENALAAARAQQVQARWIWSAALAQLAHDIGVLGLHGELPSTIGTDSLGTRR